jgi:hypothetical protein
VYMGWNHHPEHMNEPAGTLNITYHYHKPMSPLLCLCLQGKHACQ